MLSSYYEVDVEGSFDLIKGFVLGFIEGRQIEGEAIFGEEHHVGNEEKFGQLLRLLGVKGKVVRVIISCALHHLLEEALEKRKDEISIKIKNVRGIAGASFDFEYKAFAEDFGKELKKTFGNLPDRLTMEPGYEPAEIRHPEAKGVEAYAPLHDYEIKAKGRVSGSIREIIDFYGKLEHNQLVELSPVTITYKEFGDETC